MAGACEGWDGLNEDTEEELLGCLEVSISREVESQEVHF
jgi:hypothetical protein